MCRATSLRRWFERPLNVMVDQMVQEHPNHEQRKRKVDKEFEEWIDSKEGDHRR